MLHDMTTLDLALRLTAAILFFLVAIGVQMKDGRPKLNLLAAGLFVGTLSFII